MTQKVEIQKFMDNKPKSNIEIFVEQTIRQINNKELSKKFWQLAHKKKTRKVSMRIDYDVFNFYCKLGTHYQTAMNTALKVMKEALEKDEVKLNL